MAASTLTDQQKEAVISVDKNVLVAAGAGSGKTHVLVERYVELLRRNPGVTVDMIVAVTFTRKAAGEMRNRLKLKFKELSLSESNAESTERWQKCLADIDMAKIGTIHSLCESTLKAFPAEAHIDPQFEVMDDVTQTELIDESVVRAFRQALEEEAEEAAILVELNIDEVIKWCVSNLKAGIQFRESYKSMIDLDADDLLEYMNRVRANVQRDLILDTIQDKGWLLAVEYLSDVSGDGKLEEQRVNILAGVSELNRLNDPNFDPGIDECTQFWRDLVSLTDINLRIGGNKEEAKAIKKEMKVIREVAKDVTSELPVEIDATDAEQFRFCKWLVKLFERADQFYQKKKMANLYVDYNDLIFRTLKLLKAPGSLARRYFQDKLYAILVDEFQDTNNLQAELVSLMAGPDTRLFLIGDDKQSIYKFQGADVSNFNSWRNFMKGEGDSKASDLSMVGEKVSLKLTVSFRSHPVVVEFVNYLFGNVFRQSAKEISYRALFEPLKAARGEAGPEAGGQANVEMIFYPSLDEAGERLERHRRKQIESLAVADWILDKVTSGAPLLSADGTVERALRYGDFAILVSKNSDFEAVEYGLSRRAIPYSIFAGRGFLNRQEIIDIENLLAFLSNRRDSHSLLGVLRSPMFAVSDDIIHEVGSSRSGSLWQAISTAKQLFKPGYENLNKAKVMLSAFFQDMANLSLSELIRNVIVKTNYEMVLLSSVDGKQRARNLFKLISIAKDHENLSAGEFAHLLRQMREYEIKQSDAPIGTSDSVKIMTIHASKGLEFPAVALPALGNQLVRGSGRLIYHPTYGIAINSNRDDKESKPAWYGYAQKLDSQMELAERRRLMYVAMTRARDYLAMFCEQDDNKKETFRAWILAALDLDTFEVSEEPQSKCLRSGGMVANFTTRLYKSEEEDLDVREDSKSDSEFEPGDDFGAYTLIDGIYGKEKPLPDIVFDQSRVTPSNKDEKLILPANLIGTYFHKLMECILPTLTEYPKDKFFDSVAFELGVMVSHPSKRAELVREGHKLMKLFFDSKLHTMMVMAKQKFEEFPYLIVSEDGVISKRPDLIIQDEHENWYVVDFKTDDFPVTQLKGQVDRHRRQLTAYVSDLSRLTGISYTPAIYFARLGELAFLEASTSTSNYEQLKLFNS